MTKQMTIVVIGSLRVKDAHQMSTTRYLFQSYRQIHELLLWFEWCSLDVFLKNDNEMPYLESRYISYFELCKEKNSPW